MASTATIIADAVVATLNNATTLSLPFKAERWYVPVRDIRELTDLTVSVVPVSIEGELLNRASQYMEYYGIAVGIQQVIGQGAMANEHILTATDPLMAFVEEVVDLLVPEIVMEEPHARCVGYKNDPIFSPQLLDEKRVFTSVITLTIKLGR